MFAGEGKLSKSQKHLQWLLRIPLKLILMKPKLNFKDYFVTLISGKLFILQKLGKIIFSNITFKTKNKDKIKDFFVRRLGNI